MRRAFTVLLAGAVFLYPVSPDLQALQEAPPVTPAPAATPAVDDYAAREAASVSLENFVGGQEDTSSDVDWGVFWTVFFVSLILVVGVALILVLALDQPKPAKGRTPAARNPNAGPYVSEIVTSKCVLCSGSGTWTEVNCPGCDGTGTWGQHASAGKRK